jgi:hypothetical protein
MTTRVLDSRGWRGLPWGMSLIALGMLVPLFSATYLSTRPESRPILLDVGLASWLVGGIVVVEIVMFSLAPSRVELTDEGVRGRYWYGWRKVAWKDLRPGRHPYSVWQGYQLGFQTGAESWSHFFLTREQARAALTDPRYSRREEATDRVLDSLGIERKEIEAAPEP